MTENKKIIFQNIPNFQTEFYFKKMVLKSDIKGTALLPTFILHL